MSAYINVYLNQESDEIVGRVVANQILDYWDGKNYTYGGTGNHAGITKLRHIIDDMSFVFIFTTQWEGERDKAWLISDEEALQHILKSENDTLLRKYFKYDDVILEEVEQGGK